MALWLKYNASNVVILGPFVDATDGVTPETGLTVSSSDIFLFKHGSTTAVNATNSATHQSGGYYSLTLTAGNCDTVGRMYLYVNESGAAPVRHEFMVLPANVADSLYLGTDLLQVDADELDGSAPAATNLAIGGRSTIYGTAVTGTLSTDAFTVSGLSTNVGANDRLIGRTVTFYGSASIAGEQAVILDYVRATDTTGTITVSVGSTPMSGTPTNGDTFFIS